DADKARRQLLKEWYNVPALELTANDYITCRVNSVDLKNRLRDIETDCRDRLHVWLLRIVGALTAPTSMALPCRWRSRPQHHKQTYAAQQTNVQRVGLFDHLVGAGKHRGRQVEAEVLGGFQVDHQLVFHRRLHRQVGGRLTPENAIDVLGGAAELIDYIRPIRDQAPFGAEITGVVDGWQPVPRRQRRDQLAMNRRRRAAGDDHATVWRLRESRNPALDPGSVAGIDRAQLDAQRRRDGLDHAELGGSGRNGGFAQHRHARDAGRDVLQQ